MNRGSVNILILLVSMGIYLGGCSPKDATRRVLVIHSYEESYNGYPEFNRLIESQFKKEGVKADIKTLYLDCENFGVEAEPVHMRELLDSAVHNWTPEVILVNEDQATYTLLVCDHPIAKTTPVVFSGVNYPNRELLDRHPNVTGFRDRLAFIENVRVAKELFSDTIDLFTIIDYTYLDRKIRADIERQIKGQKVVAFMEGTWAGSTQKRIEYVRQEGESKFLAVGARVQNPDISLMWALRMHSFNQCYIQLKRDLTTTNIGNLCKVSSLTAINEAFGFGEKLLGGYITTLPIQVEDGVKTAVRILRGASPEEIPITDSRKEYVLDWNVLSQLNMPLSKIPSKYHILDIPLRERYPITWLVFTALFTLSVLALIVWLFLLYRRETKRKRNVQRALADEKQTLALAIEGSSTYAWKFENDWFILEKAFWRSQGVPPRDLSFEEVVAIVHPDDRESLKLNWEKEKIKRRIAPMRCDFNGKGYLWWEFRYTTAKLPDGGFRTAGLALNIQQIKDREKELEEARLLAEKAELKQSFLANMSHEIRTPLNAIVGFSNLLVTDEELEPEERVAFIETINRNSELLLKLINDILDLSRMESGYISFELEDCSVAELVDNVYTTHRMMIPSQLEFLKETVDTPLVIHADTSRLTQVLSNFLNNAGKFTTEGYIKLGYTHLPDKQQVVVFVEDTGRGVPHDHQKMIFSRFYKQDEFTQGTGLGLSICQVIIEKLGGRIELWSEPGRGSRFSVILPCKVGSL